jgi:hypothetical protein
VGAVMSCTDEMQTKWVDELKEVAHAEPFEEVSQHDLCRVGFGVLAIWFL